MLTGFYKHELGKARPFILAELDFPKLEIENQEVEFLIDTGADVTMLSEKDAIRLGMDFSKLEKAKKDLGGLGGRAATYFAEAAIKIQSFKSQIRIVVIRHEIPKTLAAEEQQDLKRFYQRIPSILGRDVLDNFGLFINKKTNKICLLEDSELPEV